MSEFNGPLTPALIEKLLARGKGSIDVSKPLREVMKTVNPAPIFSFDYNEFSVSVLNMGSSASSLPHFKWHLSNAHGTGEKFSVSLMYDLSLNDLFVFMKSSNIKELLFFSDMPGELERSLLKRSDLFEFC